MKQLYIYMLDSFIFMLITLINVMIAVAFLTLFERKTLSYMHYRKGPNKVSMIGMLQPFSDALKLLNKEFFYPNKSNLILFFISPMIMFVMIMSLWLIYPFYMNLMNPSMNFMYLLCFMSLSVYGLMIAGWSSNSMFSLIGSIRSIAQTISYEVTLSITMLIIMNMMNKINLNYLPMMQKFIFLLMLFWPMAMILFISLLAEMNRTPFDLSEGESELVSGFNVEYSSSGFVLIFLSEYASILFSSFIFSMMFMTMVNYLNSLFLFTTIISFIVIWIRATLPRIRYDMLMYLCWFYFLPNILLMYMYTIIFLKYPIELILMN